MDICRQNRELFAQIREPNRPAEYKHMAHARKVTTDGMSNGGLCPTLRVGSMPKEREDAARYSL